MGNYMTRQYNVNENSIINRFPVITPRHVPRGMEYPPNYEKFNPENYKEKFEYPKREEPKYW
jgi:hypothetical protein